MYVYLKFEGKIRVISNVTIDDDCGPVVDDRKLQLQDSPRPSPPRDDKSTTFSWFSSKSFIDAIAWFKTLAIESVYIDCGSRDVKWCPRSVIIRDSPPQSPVEMRRKPFRTTAKRNLNPFIPESARLLFSDHPGVIDFNPIIDELFERAEELCYNWENWTDDSGKINKEVAQILHCYVLPAVVFQKEDAPVLRECRRIITHRHRVTENSIMEKEGCISMLEKIINKKKEDLLANEGLTMQAYLEVCDIEFVNQFYVHITKDIQKRNMKLEIVQLKINDLKKSMAEPSKLADLKVKRDTLYENVQKLIVVREAIRNYLYRPFIPKKKKKKWKGPKKIVLGKEEITLMQSFQTVHKQLIQEKDQLKLLCYRKLHTASVREAIQSTIQMLQQDGVPESLGDFSEFSIHADGNTSLELSCSESAEKHRRQWQSMQQRVEFWMERDSAIYRAHKEGCQLIRDLAEGMLSEWRIASMGLEPTDLKEGEGKGEVQQKADEIDVVELFSLSNSSGSAIGTVLAVDHGAMGEAEGCDDLSSKRAPMVQVIRDQVLLHTMDMAELIVKQIDVDLTPGSRHTNRAWVCYSSHFWKEVKDAVVRVYAHYHAPQAKRVHRHVAAMALADMMDSKMFEAIFNPASAIPSSSGSESFEDLGGAGLPVLLRLPSADTVSAISLDLQRCSVTDLYAKVNRDGARLKCQMLEIESIRCSVSLEGSSSDEGRGERSSVADTVVKGDRGTGGDTEVITYNDDKDSDKDGKGDTVKSLKDELDDLPPSSASSESGASIHWDDLYDNSSDSDRHHQSPDSENSDKTIRSSQTVQSVLGLFDSIVGPYHAKVREVLAAPDIMEKLKCVWQSVDFLSRKAGELCNQRGMDQLLPLSIFATASFPEDLFVDYYIELLILQDLKPSFALHSMYDFSLTSAFSTYMYLFEKRFSESVGGTSHQSAR